MTLVFSPLVKELIDVPLEIQLNIVKYVILDYLRTSGCEFSGERWFTMDTTAGLFQTPLHHLTVLMGIDTVWDKLLAEAIEELTFDHSIFYSKQLDKFVDFVLTHSIKIHLKAPYRIKLNKLGLELLHHGCRRYISTVNSETLDLDLDLDVNVDVDVNSLEFITFLNCALESLGDVFKWTKNLELLEHLTCLKILTASSQMDLLDEEIVYKLVSWRRECVGNRKKRVVLSFDLNYLDKKSLLASVFVSKLAYFNRNEDFEIVYQGLHASGSLGTHLLSNPYEYDIPLVELLELTNPLDNPALGELVQTAQDADRIMALVEDDTLEYHISTDFTVTKMANDFTYMQILVTKSKFSFKYVGSLKSLVLMNCTISYECLNSLPDTLMSLTMRSIKFNDYKFPKIRLPIHLTTLTVWESPDEGPVLSDIVNRNQLNGLSNVDIVLFMGDAPEDYTDLERFESVYFQLKKFLHELSVLRILRLSIIGECTKQMVERLSLNTLNSVSDFSFGIDRNRFDFPIKYLPPTCHMLQLSAFSTLSGQFSETIKTLDVELLGYTKSFEYFWDRFITPLNNLYCLKITLSKTTETIDFSYLQFPEHLHTLELFRGYGDCKFIFNELPQSMIYVLLDFPEMQPTEKSVVFQNVDDESFESMKNDVFVFRFKDILA
ncbi:unnamed protein product [Ambrosiozyma monospora]|uniref:Unnamed protein product n=1 Tax=Ambrosiozyma monospora TaxID=43982 RepID=A0ACB5SX39_AMBMO|nr:unnamed protein product [Ambrosiozyma monospora]